MLNKSCQIYYSYNLGAGSRAPGLPAPIEIHCLPIAVLTVLDAGL